MNINIQKDIIRKQEDQNGIKVREFFKRFITDFQKNDRHEYKEKVEAMNANEKTTLIVDGQDLMNYDGQLYNYIIANYYKVQKFLNEALQQYISNTFNKDNKTIIYNIFFTNISTLPIRLLKTKEIGKLLQISGTVTRTGQVQPELYSGSFVCSITGKKSELIEQQFKYTQPTTCGSQIKHKWNLVPKDSIFTDFQKIKLQESSSEIPAGSMPRSIDVILRNELCEKVKPGDKAQFVGTLLVVPDVVAMSKVGEKNQIEKKTENIRQKQNVGTEGVTGLAQCGQRDLNYKMIFMACGVDNNESRFDETDSDENSYLANLPEAELQVIREMKQSENLIDKMSESICPTIYGHKEIKKGILLQMIGGLNKKTQSGITLRGDINTCVVGDPSTAKSQFLKYVNNFLPRSVYTSGKASTSAGLTASVVRDPETNEMCIEAGALMLADHGICCIDEFDKMDEKDQVAIHEAMEQQTISIAKAGIHATLNARASILAAANPVFGRYDKSKSLKFNLQMSAPLMSRFDLFFVVLDETNDVQDRQIANYILEQHRGTLKQKQISLFTKEQLQLYIKYCRNQIKPIMTKEAAQTIQTRYTALRMNDVSKSSSYRITVRQLESLIRLSEAIARLHLDEQIKKEYVEEASRLLSTSILKIEKADIVEDEVDAIQFPEQQQGGQLDQDIAAQQQQQRRLESKIVLTYDQYETIAKFIISYVQKILKQQEQSMKQNKSDEVALIEDLPGIKQQDIAEAYVTTLVENDQIENLNESNKAMKIVHTVIQRLIQKENILIVVQGDDINYRDRILNIHQNYTNGF